MASLFAKRVASNLLRVKWVASCSRLFSTTGYQYVQHDNEGECILKYDDKHGSSFIRGLVNDAFSSHLIPIGNLARLLHVADARVGFKTRVLPRWNAVESDEALYLFRDMPATYEYGPYIPKKKIMFRPPAKDVKELVPKMETIRERDLRPIVGLMRGIKGVHSEYHYDVMQDAEEVDSFIESMMSSIVTGSLNIKERLSVYGVLDHPQAVYIIVGFGTPGIGNPYGGYAYEMFAEDGFYDIFGVLSDLKSDIWEITIPKNKWEYIQTIRGNLIFFRERNVSKPTLWRPT